MAWPGAEGSLELYRADIILKKAQLALRLLIHLLTTHSLRSLDQARGGPLQRNTRGKACQGPSAPVAPGVRSTNHNTREKEYMGLVERAVGTDGRREGMAGQ